MLKVVKGFLVCEILLQQSTKVLPLGAALIWVNSETVGQLTRSRKHFCSGIDSSTISSNSFSIVTLLPQ